MINSKRYASRDIPPEGFGMYHRRLAVAGILGMSQCEHGFTAAIIGVDIMRDETCFKVPSIAHSGGRSSGYIQIFGNDEFDTFDKDVSASCLVVSRNGHGFHASLVFHAVFIDLREDRCKCDSLAGANIFDGDVHLNDPADGFQINIAHIDDKGIGTALDRKIDRHWTWFRIHNDIAFYGNGRSGERDDVSFRIRIFDRLIDKLGA